MKHESVELAIIGGGAAGLFAAASALSRQVPCLVIERKARVERSMATDSLNRLPCGVRRGQRAKARELQEACYRYWEIGCEKAAVKKANNGKVRYGDVYAYFRRELAAIGVKTGEAFERILLRRLKRLSKQAVSP